MSGNRYSLCKLFSARVFGDMFCDVWYTSKLTDERSFFQNVIDAWLESVSCHYLLEMCTGRFRLSFTRFYGRYRPYCCTPAQTVADKPTGVKKQFANSNNHTHFDVTSVWLTFLFFWDMLLSLGSQFLMLQQHYIPSKCWESNTHGHSMISQESIILSYSHILL